MEKSDKNNPESQVENLNAVSSASEIESTPDAELTPDTKSETGLLDHLRELRNRLFKVALAIFICFLICYNFSQFFFDIILKPLLLVLPAMSHLIYTSLPEAFFTHLKIALLAGLFISSPYSFYQFWAFVAPGLYAEERRFIIPIALTSALFFICGALFGYFIVFPVAFTFFLSHSTEFVVAMPSLSEYLNFCLQLLLAFGLIFELPILAFFLGKLGLITAKQLKSFRKYAVLVAFILGALLTPPDVVSQFLMAVPLLVLYELSIFIVWLIQRKVNRTKIFFI